MLLFSLPLLLLGIVDGNTYRFFPVDDDDDDDDVAASIAILHCCVFQYTQYRFVLVRWT